MKLEDFAGTQRRTGTVPWFETLPKKLQDECVQGYLNGIPMTVIARWLKGEGHEGASTSKVVTGIKTAIDKQGT